MENLHRLPLRTNVISYTVSMVFFPDLFIARSFIHTVYFEQSFTTCGDFRTRRGRSSSRRRYALSSRSRDFISSSRFSTPLSCGRSRWLMPYALCHSSLGELRSLYSRLYVKARWLSSVYVCVCILVHTRVSLLIHEIVYRVACI